MLRCSKCGCPNPDGRIDCYRCGTVLDPNQKRYGKTDVLQVLSIVFTVLAALVGVLTIVALFDIWDSGNTTRTSTPEFPLPTGRIVAWTLVGGATFAAYLYTIGRVLVWMAMVRDYLAVMTLRDPNAVSTAPAQSAQQAPSQT